MATHKIGTIVIAEATTWTQHYETASWFTDYAIPAGTYDVMAAIEWTNDGGGYNRLPYYAVWYVAQGIVTRSHFVNRLFQFRSAVDDNDVGQLRTVRPPVSLTDPRVTLVPGLLPNGPPRTYESPAVNLKALAA